MKSIDLPAPPDLAALIDAHIAAMQGDDWKARSTAHSKLIHWPGYRRAVTYYHRDIRVFTTHIEDGAAKIGPWPRVERPERIAR